MKSIIDIRKIIKYYVIYNLLMVFSSSAIALVYAINHDPLTKDNAPQILAGYNRMNKAQQSKFNLDAFVPYFKKFHLYLGISFIILGLLISYFLTKGVFSTFVIAYPILAYIYLFWYSRRFY